MEEYLKETKMLNFNSAKISDLVREKGWLELDEFHKIKNIYEFVQNDILFGYNSTDILSAVEVLQDGFGQCNTKATLLMALLRSVNIPCRLHAFNVSKDFQKGALPQIIYLLAPKYILHTWVEVFFNDKWIALEGVIIDKDYLYTVQQKYTEYKGIFKKFAIATKDLETVNIAWRGNDVFIQKEAVVDDYGIFSSPDILFSKHTQNMSKIKLYLYSHIGTKMMTKRVFKIRNSKK
ncbi:transglutaminase family protein [Faecalibacillus sp. MSK20_93]|uniref:transglutaminase-like domain-containing protein n=1 Tax=Faecalibacillus sp. MSK20_93 TaxID=2884903 RepID=UPI0001F026D9|nr:transglutaminase family protein [Faecalibacillus sp. MSK20_93]EFV15255.1 transglutaminase-like superfamily protein [Lachnospiraceae bacterium 5_1_63FAA]MCB7510861.1 transglutaminase family protein [bacterium MSK20_81]MCB8551912.1 transglutaminase family protein [Faecalibacillus sp. MSK20_93]